MAKSKYALLKNEGDLVEKERKKLEEVYKVSPKLGEMHKLKEEFREVFEKNTEGNEGLFALSDWLKKAMAYFPKSCQTMRRWIDEITAYFDNRTTQGTVEGINNKLKVIKRRGYGFRNFKNFSLRCLLNWHFASLFYMVSSEEPYLARVEAEIYDEDPIFKSQDKTLIAVHYARIAERALSERDKQKMFSYTYKVGILGTFTDSGSSILFTTAVRKLPTVSYIARHLNKREIDSILNKTNENGAEIGYLCVGETVFQGKGLILFKIDKLRNKRTMVFAQSAFGKTNLVKLLLYHMTRDTSYGKLIFDLNGEYFLRGTATYGLGDINENSIKDNVVVYTDKKLPEIYKTENRFIFVGKVSLNMHKHLAVGDILNFGAGFSEVMKSFLLYLDEEGVSNFIEKIDDYADNPSNLYRDFSDFFGEQKKDAKGNIKEDFSARKTIMAIQKRIRHLIDEGSLHSSSSNLIENVFKCLKQGKTVIIDLSLKDNMDASIISTILVRKLFESNKEEFTSDKPEEVVNAVVFVEEAQNVLSQEFVKSNANPFVRVAKEGRKGSSGIVMQIINLK